VLPDYLARTLPRHPLRVRSVRRLEEVAVLAPGRGGRQGMVRPCWAPSKRPEAVVVCFPLELLTGRSPASS
jgi:hypothetical protein